MERVCLMVGIDSGRRTAWNTFVVKTVHSKETKLSALSVASLTSVMKKD
jgi:hypothetical protein